MPQWIEQPEISILRLDAVGLSNSGETRRVTGADPGLVRQEAAGWVHGRLSK